MGEPHLYTKAEMDEQLSRLSDANKKVEELMRYREAFDKAAERWATQAENLTAERDALAADNAVLREELKHLSALTPGAANAATARDLHITVQAIADAALSNQSTASLKVEAPIDQTLRDAAKAMAAEAVRNPILVVAAEGQGERGEAAKRCAQHVAYFDDGEFHWMSGIAPRNCELYAVPSAPQPEGAVRNSHPQGTGGTAMSARAELKPCPMCGGKAKLHSGRASEDSMSASVACGKCGLQTDYFEDAYTPFDEAIAAWNRRTPEPGTRVLRDGQLDDFTREQAAKVADASAQNTRAMANDHARYNKFERRDLESMAIAYIGLAAAIRAMGETP